MIWDLQHQSEFAHLSKRCYKSLILNTSISQKLIWLFNLATQLVHNHRILLLSIIIIVSVTIIIIQHQDQNYSSNIKIKNNKLSKWLTNKEWLLSHLLKTSTIKYPVLDHKHFNKYSKKILIML